MTAFNAENFIAQAIESVLKQTYSNFEFIIVNDGSTDSTLKIIKEYALIDTRIELIDHPNIGMGESLNKAIEIAKGDLIVRMDSDDIMMNNRIEEQIHYLHNNKNVAVLSCLAYYINERNEIIGKTFSDLKTVADCRKYYKNNEAIGLLHPGVVFRKNIIKELGGYRGKFWPAEDIDLWNRVVEEGYDIITLQIILMKYRIHNSSSITSKFIESRKKFEWVRETMWCRRKGEIEPTWDEYLEKLNNQTFIKKINWKRKTYAKHYYRAGGFDFAKKNYGIFICHLIAAFILQPIYVLNKINKQWVK